MADVIVYVDGFNLYYGSLKRTPYKWLDLGRLYGHFLTHSVSMALTGVTPTQRVWVDKTEEKGSDVNLASHLVRDAYQQAFQVAVLITNDSDLAEPVRIVRQELNLPVGVLNPHQHHSAELKRVATFLKRIRQSDLIASQFPAALNDAKGAFHKPASW